MNNKVFLSGPITGVADYRRRFERASAVVREPGFFDRYGNAALSYRYGYFGFVAVDPCTFRLMGRPMERWPWAVAMAVCLWHLLFCSTVYQLDGWRASRGARIEYRVARLLGKRVIEGKVESLLTDKTKKG